MEGSQRIEALLLAAVALLADQRDRELGRAAGERKNENLLADAGLDPKSIAVVLNKNYDAVRKAIQRGRSEP